MLSFTWVNHLQQNYIYYENQKIRHVPWSVLGVSKLCICLSVCLSVCQPASQPASQPACLPACLPACMYESREISAKIRLNPEELELLE